MNIDHHVHSTYSDGDLLRRMLDAAEAVNLDAVGIADHCSVSPRAAMTEARDRLGFTLDETYPRRRRALRALNEERSITVHDAVEMDYDPRDEGEIGAFLDDANFDYAIGSVHHLEGVNVHVADYFADRPASEREALVETYFEKLIDLIDSELFAVAAHPDLVERTPALRGFATAEQYETVAKAFASSRTVPELNAGRALRTYGSVHPAGPFRDALAKREIPVVVGSDAHRPGELRRRVRYLRGFLDGRDLRTVSPV